jgi:hypothetical protein
VLGEQELTDPFDAADMDYIASCVYRQLGRLDTAEALAASSMRRWACKPDARRDSVEGAIALASLHARAGVLDSVALGQQAISQVSELRSTRARMKLRNLARVSKDLEAPLWFPQVQQFSIFNLVYCPRQRLGVYRSRSKIV